MRLSLFLVLTLMLSSGQTIAESGHRSPYAGQETRAIKSLSAQDIDDLQNGRGWGLAKAAELNGAPGPAHLLELRKEIGLTPRQVAQVEALYRAMKAKATALGVRLIELERGLNESFANRTVTQASLESQLTAIADVQKALRLTHLETHLRTPAILTGRQIAAYNRLRGYGDHNPCADGHRGHGEGGKAHGAKDC